jgi:methionine synthase I (cobalamin-dependent)
VDGLADALHRRLLVLDGGMGQRLVQRGLDLAQGDPSLWCLERPEAVAEVHRADIAAGADLVFTNTFGANRAWLARYRHQSDVGAINRAATRLAREAAGRSAWVLGNLGPTAAEDHRALREQAEVLLEAGVDGLILETVMIAQVETAWPVVSSLARLTPLLISLRCGGGMPSRAVARACAGVGWNCGEIEATIAALEAYDGAPDVPLLAKPACADPSGKVTTPQELARAVPRLAALGARLLGGCCGAGSDHVRALRAAVDELGGDSNATGACGGGEVRL